MVFEENHSSCCLKTHSSVQNLDFYQFFRSERIMHFKKYVKKVFMKKMVRTVFEIFTSGLIFGLLNPTSGFSIFAKT